MPIVIGLLACALLLAMIAYNIKEFATLVDKVLGVVGYSVASLFVIFAVYIFLGVKL